MILTSEEIYNQLRYKEMQYTGNITDEIVTYQVQGRSVTLYIEKTTTNRYKIVMKDLEGGDLAETEVLFTVYPKKCIEHGIIIGNNNNRVYYKNSGIQKNIKEILKALGKLYNLPISTKRI